MDSTFCSLDCRHVFCGICIAGVFVAARNSSCPECRITSNRRPQRDFALRDVLRAVYANKGREVPAFDDRIFIRIYERLEEFRMSYFTVQESRNFWAPIITEVQQMRNGPLRVDQAPQVDQAPASPQSVIVIEDDDDDDGDGDIDMEEIDHSDWEPGSGFGSEEDEGENVAEIEQGEGGANVEQYEAYVL